MDRSPSSWVGTSGWVYQHWRGRFYPADLPQGRWLEFYARHFATVEVNAPFYRLPSAAAVVAWRERVPPGFRYAVKASRLITHLKRLKDCADPLAVFLDRARLLGPKLGPVLYQLPSDLPQDTALLAEFLDLLPHDLQHTIEFRHASWFAEAVYDLLRAHNVALCIHDWQGMACPLAVTATFAYFRFHGPTGYYTGQYGEDALRGWAQRIREAVAGLEDVYAYFNNDAQAWAVEDARTLRRLLGA
ncbi:MAG: DUF72 domain-containing protein [Chloroflexi bacterium]|nr:DUF72 domain-containing protein [Chloroflexota bacterium]